jgi:ribosome-associated protein
VSVVSTATPVRDWCEVAAQAASAKKGADTVILAMGPLLEITDAFVITSGANPRQIRTICEEVELRLKRAGGPRPLSVEGLADTSWVLMDYGDFVVHVFAEETRAFYDLERLWGNAERWAWADVPAEELMAAAE